MEDVDDDDIDDDEIDSDDNNGDHDNGDDDDDVVCHAMTVLKDLDNTMVFSFLLFGELADRPQSECGLYED